MARFRSQVWDPSLIASQIVSMQCQFYSSLLLFYYLLNRLLNASFQSDPASYSLGHIFDYRLVNFQSTSNAFVCISFLVNSVISALFQWRLVNRSKQCLDFTVTVLLNHAIVSWIYSGSFPSTFLFWLIMVVSGTVQTLISEYLSMQSALKEIPLLSAKAHI